MNVQGRECIGSSTDHHAQHAMQEMAGDHGACKSATVHCQQRRFERPSAFGPHFTSHYRAVCSARLGCAKMSCITKYVIPGSSLPYVKHDMSRESIEKHFRAGYGPQENPKWYNPASWPSKYRMQVPGQAVFWGSWVAMNYYRQRPFYTGERGPLAITVCRPCLRRRRQCRVRHRHLQNGRNEGVVAGVAGGDHRALHVAASGGFCAFEARYGCFFTSCAH